MKKLSSKLFGSLAMAALFCASMSFSSTVSAEEYTIDNVDVVVTQNMQENLGIQTNTVIIVKDRIFITRPVLN